MSGARSALVVACERYLDPGLRQLRSPITDVAALARVLGDPEVGGFTVRSLLNEPRQLVEEAVEALLADSQRDDLLLLYFSCHGVKDPAGRLYFAAANTRLDRLGSTATSAGWVNDQLDHARATGVVVLLDCCYSGAFARGLAPRAGGEVDVLERLKGRGRAVITASTALEYAFEAGAPLSAMDSAAQPSVFTQAVVAGLESGEAQAVLQGAAAGGGLGSPYFIWPKVNPLRRGPSVIEAVPAPGTAAQLAERERSLRHARRWVQEARDRRDGLYQQQDPLRLLPFELRLLARRQPPSRPLGDRPWPGRRRAGAAPVVLRGRQPRGPPVRARRVRAPVCGAGMATRVTRPDDRHHDDAGSPVLVAACSDVTA